MFASPTTFNLNGIDEPNESCRFPRSPSPRGFSLVELLVVIGIIALLVGILMPALGRARAAADSVKCMSNLRQINQAMILFSQSNNGRLPQTCAKTDKEKFAINGVDTDVSVRWFGGFVGNSFVAEASMLAPYWGTAEIGGCPTQINEQVSRPQYGPCDYAYNALFGRHKEWVDNNTSTARTGLGVVLSSIRRSSEKALVWDSARLMSDEPDRTPWGYPTTGNVLNNKTDPNFQGRHNKYGNVGWADGHVSSFRPAFFATYNGGQNVEKLKEFNIGDIDSDQDQTTNENYVSE